MSKGEGMLCVMHKPSEGAGRHAWMSEDEGMLCVCVQARCVCMLISQVVSKRRNWRSSATETSSMEVTVSAELTVSLSPVLSLSGRQSDPETTGEAELSTPQQSKTLNWLV